MSTSKVIIFDTSKQQIGNPGSNLKKFVKKYKESYKIGLNKDTVDFEKIKKAHLFVIAAPKDQYAPTEIEDLRKYVENGGNLLLLSHEGGERKNNTNIGEVTKKFGITINSDCVIRTSFYKYFHPKEAYIHNGILNEEVTRVINGYAKEPKGKINNAFMLGGREDDEEQYQKQSKRTGVDFVFVNGASLNVAAPANAILTSGPLTYPCNRPICGIYQHPKSGGKLVVCGSVTMFTDDYFQQEENAKIMDFFLKFFFTQEVDFQFSKDDNQNGAYVYVPDIAEIADNLKSCFHEGQEIPKDFTTMFQTDLFKYDFDTVPEVAALFAKMQVKHQPLTLIVPQFQTPLLGLAPGVFLPVLKELPNPSLQLFDLDDEFSQQKVRLAQLTNKCEDGDLQYYIREAGDILGVSEKVKNRTEPKAIMKYILDQIVSVYRFRLTLRRVILADSDHMPLNLLVALSNCILFLFENYNDISFRVSSIDQKKSSLETFHTAQNKMIFTLTYLVMKDGSDECLAGEVRLYADNISYYIQMQQNSDSQLIRTILAKFEQDETEVTRYLLQKIQSGESDSLDHLKVLNLLLSNKNVTARQRRDVAAIARAVADSNVFATLQIAIHEQTANQVESQGRVAIETAKLIWLICAQNPHFVDNINGSSATIIETLFDLYSREESTPTDSDSLQCIVNFFHAVSMKQSTIRTEKLRVPFQSFLVNILSKNRFCEFTQQKKYQLFIGALFKFHANVAVVAKYIFHSLMRALREINQGYKQLAEDFKNYNANRGSSEEMTVLVQRVSFADKKLASVMRLYERSKSNVFYRFDAFSFTALLKILIKIAIMRPVALVGLPSENRILCNIIGDLMETISNYQKDITRRKLVQSKPQSTETELMDEEMSSGTTDRIEQIQPHQHNSEQQERNVYNETELLRFEQQSLKFTLIKEVTCKFSETYYKIIRSTIDTLVTAFKSAKDDDIRGNEAKKFNSVLIEILTVRLERILTLIMKLFSQQELRRGGYYQKILEQLYDLMPYYFQLSLESQMKCLKMELPKLIDVTGESEISLTRYLYDRLDEEAVKSQVHTKMVQCVNTYFTIYEAITKFGYHLATCEDALEHSTRTFIHKFIAHFQQTYLKDMLQADILTLDNVECLRIVLKFIVQLFPVPLGHENRSDMDNKHKIYWYCRIAQYQPQNNIFQLLAHILNLLERHNPEQTTDLIDTLANREEVVKTIFTKMMLQRIRSFVTAITAANLSQIAIGLPTSSLPSATLSIKKSFTDDYISFSSCMVRLIKSIVLGPYDLTHKQDVVAILMSNIFAYNIGFGGIIIEEIKVQENNCKLKLKSYMDQLSSELLDWLLINLRCHIIRLPMIIKKVLHFNKVEVAIQNRELEMNQEQNTFIRKFFLSVSEIVNQSYFRFTGKNLNLCVGLDRKKRGEQIEEELTPPWEVSRLANICAIISQFVGLLTHQTLALIRHFSVTDNYIISLIDYATILLSELKAQVYFRSEANELIRNSLWLVSSYLKYKDYRMEQQRQKRQFAKKQKKRKAKERRRNARKERIKAEKVRRQAVVTEIVEDQKRDESQEEQSAWRVELRKLVRPLQQKNKKRRRRNHRSKKRVHNEVEEDVGKDEAPSLKKSSSKVNLFAGLDKPDRNQSHRRESNGRQRNGKNGKRKKQKSIFQSRVQTYLKDILVVANRGVKPLLSNITLQYYLKFVSQNLRVNILSIPLHRDFELNFCDLLEELLKIKVTDRKMPGYHLLLSKIGIQMLDENHLRVDYQLGIKRYLFQNIESDIQLSDFVKFTKENFQEMPNTSHLVEIVGQERDEEGTKTVRLPFIEENYSKLMSEGKGKEYKIMARQGVELHILNTKQDSQSKRKPSNTMQDEKKQDKSSKPIKITDYIPEGDIYLFVKSLINQVLKIMIDELDRSYTEQQKQSTDFKPETVVQPFNIKVIIHTLQLLIRQSPSLAPFIAKFKCKRVLLSLLKGENILKHKQEVTTTIMNLMGFRINENDVNNIPQVGFLSVVLKLLSPMITNSISGLVFELCLDSTPLVQLTEQSKKQQKKNMYASFGSVIRLKTVEQISCILFQNPNILQTVFRKLCITNLVTVLMNLREMVKLFIDFKFVDRLLEYYQILKTALSRTKEDLISSVYCTKVLIPFLLNPIGLLQQVNIWLHHNKKLNKNQQRVRISQALNKDSINAQLIPQDALKKNKFKSNWPYNKKDENHIVDQNENAPFFVGNLSDSDVDQDAPDSDSSDDQNISSSSGFSNRYAQLEQELNGDQQDSYISLEEVPNRLLNQEWDYDDHSSSNGGREDRHDIDMEYPQQDMINESEDNEQQLDEDNSGMDESQSLDGLGSESSNSDDMQNSLPSLISRPYNNQDLLSFSRIRKASVPDEQDLFQNISDIVNFQKINVVRKISKVQIQQVLSLRFFLQLQGFHKRMMQNLHDPHTVSIHERKQQKYAQDQMPLLDVFIKDQHLHHCEWIEWNQIYRYDHFLKQTPLTVKRLDSMFSDEYEGGLLKREFMQHKRRNALIIDNHNLMQIIPGWNITDVREDNPVQNDNVQEEARFGLPNQNQEESNSHIDIHSESAEVPPISQSQGDQQPNRMQDQQQNDLRQIREILRNSNLNMSADQFFRLDAEIQEDIIQNYMIMRQERENRFNQTPHNSPIRELELPIQVQENELMEEVGVRLIPIAVNGQPIEVQPEVHQPIVQEQPQNERPQSVIEQSPASLVQEAEEVHEVYRKMSMQHNKKISKDVQQAINKDGRNNSKFSEINFSQLDAILEMFYILDENEHRTYPYNTIETLCMNTDNTTKIVSSLVALLHLAPSHCSGHFWKSKIMQENEENSYAKVVYPLVALKILHLMDHLTKTYSIAMSFFVINNKVTPTLEQWLLVEQSQKSSFQMLILLLRQKEISDSPQLLQFLVSVLSNLTVHHFYKSINKIIEKSQEESNEGLIVVDKQSVQLLGNLLQSNFIKDNLHVVSKIIMRLSIQQQNLNNFIVYMERLVRELVGEGLQDIRRWTKESGEEKSEGEGGKIVNLMYIFYEMVKAFETFPTSNEQHEVVLQSFRKIVEYPQLEQLCQTAVQNLLTSTDPTVQKKMGSMLDCFFILYEVALITSHRKVVQKKDEHKCIAELGEITLKNELKRSGSCLQSGQEILLGNFSLSKLWRENLNHPNFKVYINNNIKSKLALINRQHATTRDSIFELPIIRVAASTPHMLSFDNKRSIFKAELKRLRGKAKHDMIHMSLSRDDVFEQSYEEIIRLKPQDLKGKVKIEFKDEEGEDAGGLTREWFELLSRKMFDPNYALFRCGSAGNTHHPSSMSYVNHDHLNYFKFIGRIAGKALYDGFLLDAYFTPAFYKHILNLPITYLDMQEEDYEYFKSLKWILQNSPIEDYLQLNFTYQCDNFGEIQTKQLVTGGSMMLVTEENKLDYVQLVSYARMATNIKAQLQSFLQGLHDLIPHALLKIFNQKELQIMISGRPTIDMQDLKSNTELVNYVKNDQIIIWLFEVLQSFDMQLRTAFLQFVTGSSRVPVQGFRDLRGMNGVQKFNIHREFQEERLPRAHTCFNQLDLPNYRTKEILIEKLMLAITQGKEGFGMI